MPTPLDLHENIWNRVTVVTVTHDAGMVIGDFLESMNSSARLVIVDNASIDDTLDIIAAKRPSPTKLKISWKSIGGIGQMIKFENLNRTSTDL
jgi:hypothetical protein